MAAVGRGVVLTLTANLGLFVVVVVGLLWSCFLDWGVIALGSVVVFDVAGWGEVSAVAGTLGPVAAFGCTVVAVVGRGVVLTLMGNFGLNVVVVVSLLCSCFLDWGVIALGSVVVLDVAGWGEVSTVAGTLGPVAASCAISSCFLD